MSLLGVILLSALVLFSDECFWWSEVSCEVFRKKLVPRR